MTAYPDGPLDLRAELLLGSTWTDVTQWALPDGAQDADIQGGTSDGASQPSPNSLSMTWDNPDGRFSPRNIAGPYYGLLKRNTRARISVAAAQNYLRIPDASSGVTAPAVPAISGGVLDVRMDLDLSDWSAGASFCGAPYTAGAGSWQLGLDYNGYIDLSISPDGTNWTDVILTGYEHPKRRQCLRAAYDSSAGTVTFYSAPAGSNLGTAAWTSLGTVAAGVTGLHGTAGVVVGNPGGVPGMRGSVWGMNIYQSGTPKAYFDPTLRAAGTKSWTDALGNTWTLTGTAEVTDRDYRLHGELASIVPSVTAPGTALQAAATIAGPLRRIQAASQPPVVSPMKRAVLALAGTYAPVAYWPGEDTEGSASVASGLANGGPMYVSGSPSFGADSSFDCSAPLMTLGDGILRGRVGGYTDHGGLMVQFLMKLGQVPSSGYWPLLRMYFTGATCQLVTLRVYPQGALGLTGFGPGGGQVFDMGAVSFDTSTPQLVSLEISAVSGGQQYMIHTIPAGSPTGWNYGVTASGGVRGKLFEIAVNANEGFTDTAFGHLWVQSALTSPWDMSDPLQSWQGETAGNRFLRVAGEQGYDARILGGPDETIAMGPQPVDTFTAILQDIAQTDGGLLFEPRDSFSLGYRTLASMYNQDAAASLDYAAGNFPGSLEAADDDTDLANDWTVSRPDGSSARVTFDDPAVATSTASAGTYQNTATANTATDDALLDAAGRLLALSAADEARVRQVAADAGLPGAPAVALAALRPGDVIEIGNVPASVGTGTLRQVVTGTEEILGPGQKWTWDCQPASAYDAAVYGDRADTAGSSLNSAVTATATSISVKSTGVVWTPNSSDWPFTISVGGEVMTVTHVTGSTSPQTLTVTRGTPAMAHAAGTDVRLAKTPRYSAI